MADVLTHPLPAPDRHAQLKRLEESLALLCELLALDARCPWTAHFTQCLDTARTLQAEDFDTDALHALSRAVRSVFGGMGSFNDYVPMLHTQASSAWYRQHGNPDSVIRRVHDDAMALIVTAPSLG